MNRTDIPISAPKDSVMATKTELRQVKEWAKAAFSNETTSGSSLITSDIPFSFVYGGVPSPNFICNWNRAEKTEIRQDRTVTTITWTDPETKLSVTAEASVFDDYPAVEWVIYFENLGAADTPIIEDIRAIDVTLKTDDPAHPAIAHLTIGETEAADTFLPYDKSLNAGGSVKLAPRLGKSSSETLPFFNFEYKNEGFITAVGWTGQWSAEFNRAKDGSTRFTAGMELTHLRLHPGERIRTPRILILPWSGDRQRAHNQFRRLMLFYYMPKQDGRPARIPLSLTNFDRYSRTVPEWGTEAGQIEVVEVSARLGFDTLWLDAAWFVGDFPDGVGNWICKPKELPNGLKPVSDRCHDLGLQFLLWFEPERATVTSDLAQSHPEFFFESTIHPFGKLESRLFRLHDPEARRWMTDMLSDQISEFGVDIYRNDFNINPLSFWRETDAPDRQGMTEIRYIEGLYEMWDELRERHPGLIIDNCSGGGRRIDLEMCLRSLPMWRSDSGCSQNPCYWNQTQSYGLSNYVPLHSISAWTMDAYDCRSSVTAGAVCPWDHLNPEFPSDQAVKALTEIKENQKYWYGDFYPLTNCAPTQDHFIAYQFHRSDLDEGMVLAFRRSECNVMAIVAALRGVNADATYEVEFIDENRESSTSILSGKQLLEGLELRPSGKGSSLLIRYKTKVSGVII